MDSTLREILYLLFGIEETATMKDLKTAYRKRANEFHSDKNADVDPNIFIALTKGYELLQDDITGDDKKTETKEEEIKPHETGHELSSDVMRKIAAEKLSNVFNDIFLRHLGERFVTRKDIFLEVEQLFGRETAEIRKVNRAILEEIDLLEQAKLRIKSEKDSIALTSNVEDMISQRRISIRQNKNKIKINEFVNSFLEEYSFIHPKDINT